MANRIETLNGYPVLFQREHSNGTSTVMVERKDDPISPYVVATWWPDLGETWEWGHYYYDMAVAVLDFEDTCERNALRGRL